MSANESRRSAVGEGLRGDGPVFGFRDGRTASRGRFAGSGPRADEGTGVVFGCDKGRELVECVESAMMRRPLRSTIGPRTRSSQGSERLIRPPTVSRLLLLPMARSFSRDIAPSRSIHG